MKKRMSKVKKIKSRSKVLRNIIIIGMIVLVVLFFFAVLYSGKKEIEKEDGLTSILRDEEGDEKSSGISGGGGGSDVASGDDWEFGPITPDPSAGSTTIDPEFRCEDMCTPSSDPIIPEMPVSGMAVDECFTFCVPGGRGPRPKEYSLVKSTQISRHEAYDPSLTPEQIAEKICNGKVNDVPVPSPGGGPLGAQGWAQRTRGGINKPHIHFIIGKHMFPGGGSKPYYFTDGVIEFDDTPIGGELYNVRFAYPVAPGDGKILGSQQMHIWKLEDPVGRASFTPEQLAVLDLKLQDTENHEREHWKIFGNFDIRYMAISNAETLYIPDPNEFASILDAMDSMKNIYKTHFKRAVLAEREAHEIFDIKDFVGLQECSIPDFDIICRISPETGMCPYDDYTT